MEVRVTILGPAYFGLSEIRVLRLVLRLRDGSTVRDLLNELRVIYPSVVDIVAPNGELDDMHDIWVNGRSIRYSGGLDRVLRDGDEVIIVPPFGG